ncbi:MAG: hypothetical protein M0Z94_01435 [Dehalococcoidales bacterium]|nr:hypothetical protein [Dehalococcoidales bacterium]
MPPRSREDPEEYKLMLRLEQLETLREDMEELWVTTLAEVERRIADLHRQLDEREDKR